MTDIKDIASLNAEIKRLEAAVRFKEQQLRTHAASIKEKLRPRSLFAAAFENITGQVPPPEGKNFTAGMIKKGVSLWLSRLIFKTEEKAAQQVHEAVETLFARLKALLQRNTN